MPFLVFIDGAYAGPLTDGTLCLDVPTGNYDVRLQMGGTLPLGRSGKTVDLSLSSTASAGTKRDKDTTVTFSDSELLWNILFDIDLALWIVFLFVDEPPLYQLLSNIFFAVWLARLVVVRKRYFRVHVE